MADAKISALTDGVTADATDRIPVARAGANRYVTPAYIQTYMGLGSGTQGDVLYHNGTIWSKLGAGTSGHFLKTQGAGANPVWASAGTNSGPTYPGGVSLTGVSYPRASGNGLNTGDNDIYTVPANKRAAFFGLTLYNTSAGSITWYTQVKISGTYYRLRSNATTTTGAQTSETTGAAYIAEAGEILSINTATNNGANVYFKIVVFDNSCAVKSAKLTSLSAGDNTVYTVPGSTTALILDASLQVSSGSAGGVNYVNSSGGSRTIRWHAVPSGQAVGTNYIATASFSPADAARQNATVNASLSTGDFININTDASTATQMAWVSVMEIQ